MTERMSDERFETLAVEWGREHEELDELIDECRRARAGEAKLEEVVKGVTRSWEAEKNACYRLEDMISGRTQFDAVAEYRARLLENLHRLRSVDFQGRSWWHSLSVLELLETGEVLLEGESVATVQVGPSASKAIEIAEQRGARHERARLRERVEALERYDNDKWMVMVDDVLALLDEEGA